jgi:hypothetical protein
MGLWMLLRPLLMFQKRSQSGEKFCTELEGRLVEIRELEELWAELIAEHAHRV